MHSANYRNEASEQLHFNILDSESMKSTISSDSFTSSFISGMGKQNDHPYGRSFSY